MPSHTLSAEIWSEVTHLLSAWTWQTDTAYLLFYKNMQFEQVQGIPAEKLIGHCVLDPLGPPHPHEAGLDVYMDALRAREPVESLVYERIVMMDSVQPRFARNGSFCGYRRISFNMSRVLERSGNVDSVIAAVHIRSSELKRTLSARKTEIEELNRLMRDVVGSMGEVLLVTNGTDAQDPENRITA